MTPDQFLKVEAAGNDFLFVSFSGVEPSPSAVTRLCDRNFGIGADGLVAMERLSPHRSRWYFFNRDGSKASMCGNAARAAAAWLRYHGGLFPHHLETSFGEVQLDEHLLGHLVGHHRGFFAKVPYRDHPLQLTPIAGAHVPAVLINTGVPHVVVKKAESVLVAAKQGKLFDDAKAFRWAKEAGSQGANVTFFSSLLEENRIEAVTFERGVEGFTLSCGTGVLAAAVVSRGDFVMQSVWPKGGVEVHNPGAVLWVESEDFPHSLKLVGPARVVFTASLAEESVD